MDDERLISILCAQQWAKCKGELRALAALQGSKMPKYRDNKVINDKSWKKLRKYINSFIKTIEDEALDE